MRPEELKKTSMRFLKGVGEKRAELFSRLDIFTAYDLLFTYPRAYENWAPYSVTDAPLDTVCAVKAIISAPFSEARIRKGMTIYKGKAFDETGKISLTFFNNPYIKNLLIQGEEYIFYGKTEGNYYSKSMSSPKFIKATKALPICPIYPLTAGLTQKVVSAAISDLLSKIDIIDDTIPQSILTENDLCSLDFAIRTVHFPENEEDLKRAQRRLAFGELFYMELGLLMMGRKSRVTTDKVAHRGNMDAFFNSLPFKLTSAQLNAITEAAKDMMKPIPMNRLLQGDVGSGKTAVAAALMYFMKQSGYQSAMMAPTEILAEQHFETLKKFLEPLNMKIDLLTSSVKGAARSRVLTELEEGSTDVLVGTHAVIGDRVLFSNLGLVVTDEQHRFGVEQRGKLTKKGGPAHTLVMSATPIPRTLALMIYGDLDISVLDELPPGRREIRTYHVDTLARDRVDGFVEKHFTAGRQTYVVCPSIEEGTDSVKEHYDRLCKRFPNAKIGLLHGKMKSADKEKAMRSFTENQTDILVSTTVIEVGVDVPNATLMVIEEADKFGLSQLHQLRGRVGRSDKQSFCVLVSDARGEEANTRLDAMVSSSDGFEIARQDLLLRGPGDFFGSRQHGLPLLNIADLHSDMDILQSALKSATDLLDSDPELTGLEHASLKEGVNILFESVNN